MGAVGKGSGGLRVIDPRGRRLLRPNLVRRPRQQVKVPVRARPRPRASLVADGASRPQGRPRRSPEPCP